MLHMSGWKESQALSRVFNLHQLSTFLWCSLTGSRRTDSWAAHMRPESHNKGYKREHWQNLCQSIFDWPSEKRASTLWHSKRLWIDNMALDCSIKPESPSAALQCIRSLCFTKNLAQHLGQKICTSRHALCLLKCLKGKAKIKIIKKVHSQILGAQ